MVGARFEVLDTVIENGASETFFEPSVTMIVMFAYVPTLAVVGVPLSLPDTALNVAHAGLFAMLKRSGSPSASLAAGWNAYVALMAAAVAGEPEITGAVLSRLLARIEKLFSARVLRPSLTAMRMSVHQPTVVGVPESCPVDVLKLAHAGLLAIVKRRVVLSGSVAVGRNEYGEPTYTQLEGAPEMVGGVAAFAVVLRTAPSTSKAAETFNFDILTLDIRQTSVNSPPRARAHSEHSCLAREVGATGV